jgi:hypothetical protein
VRASCSVSGVRSAFGLGRRNAFLPAAAFALSFAAGCSALVSVDGLTGGDGGEQALSEQDAGAAAFDAGGGGGVVLGDAGGSTASEGDSGAAADANTPTDPFDAGDAGESADVSAPIDAGTPHDASDGATPVDSGTLVDAGHDAGTDAGHDAGHDAGPGGCSNDLSNIGTGNFTITFDLRTTASGRVALVNQRGVCGPATFWDLRLTGGEIQIETDDVTSYTLLVGTGAELNDGAPHVIVAQRVNGTVTLYADGASRGATNAPASFGALSPIATGTDVCDGSSDGTVAFTGTITGLCVSSP